MRTYSNEVDQCDTCERTVVLGAYGWTLVRGPGGLPHAVVPRRRTQQKRDDEKLRKLLNDNGLDLLIP